MNKKGIVLLNMFLFLLAFAFDLSVMNHKMISVIVLILFMADLGAISYMIYQYRKSIQNDNQKNVHIIEAKLNESKLSDKEKARFYKLAQLEKVNKEQMKSSKIDSDATFDFVKNQYIQESFLGDMIFGAQLLFFYIAFIKIIQMFQANSPFFTTSIHVSVILFFVVAVFILLPLLQSDNRRKLIDNYSGRTPVQMVVVAIALLFMMFDQLLKSMTDLNPVMDYYLYGEVNLFTTSVSGLVFVVVIVVLQYTRKVLNI